MLEKILEKAKPIDTVIVLLGAFAIISFWRGIWGLMDLYLFPKNIRQSLWASVIIGFIILIMISLYNGKPRKKNKK